MPDRTLRLALAAILATCPLTGLASAAERPARSRLCAEDLPEGVRLPRQPGCDARAASPTVRERDDFRDLGEGTSVRIGGRVGAEFGARR